MKKLLTLLVATLMLVASVFTMTACVGGDDSGKSNLPEGVACQITFDESKSKVTRMRVSNFYDDSITIGNYMNIKEPAAGQAKDGKALIMDIDNVPGATEHFWIAGMHFDVSNKNWGRKADFKGVKKVTFDYYSEVDYRLATAQYGFIVEWAWKVMNEETTDADWIKITVPFGIQKTGGNWYTATVVFDEMTAWRFEGFADVLDENGDPTFDANGNPLYNEIDYAFEWMQIGLSWEGEEWETGRFMIDNIKFWNVLDATDVVPIEGQLKLQSKNHLGQVVSPTH